MMQSSVMISTLTHSVQGMNNFFWFFLWRPRKDVDMFGWFCVVDTVHTRNMIFTGWKVVSWNRLAYC